jgi:hypothetical protein
MWPDLSRPARHYGARWAEPAAKEETRKWLSRLQWLALAAVGIWVSLGTWGN